jgi:hypothetical protein
MKTSSKKSDKPYKTLFLVLILSFIIFSPSLFTFFTNDDFFHLNISNADNLKEFLNFFNFTIKPGGYGFYRPLTTQVFYFLGRSLFSLNPFPLHLISMSFFLTITYLVYVLTDILTKQKKTALVTAFFYSISAIHFGHAYYLSTFQEVGMAFFFLIALIQIIKYYQTFKITNYSISLTSFILSLISKETAVIFPFIAFSTLLFFGNKKLTKHELNKIIKTMLPFFIILAIYIYFHFFLYGTPSGDYYQFNFSPHKITNTLFWYFLWTLSIPEMFIDFVGPRLSVNPKLFTYWSNDVFKIGISFVIFVTIFFFSFTKNISKNIKHKIKLIVFTSLWFVLTISPVLFLPDHKFSFYLTLPAVGIYILLAYFLVHSQNKGLMVSGLISFFLLSIFSLNLIKRTHWTIRSSQISQSVFNYIETNRSTLSGKTLVFYDEEQDEDLPWLPTDLVKTALSDKNFFEVFFPNKFEDVYYGIQNKKEDDKLIPARQFLGY